MLFSKQAFNSLVAIDLISLIKSSELFAYTNPLVITSGPAIIL